MVPKATGDVDVDGSLEVVFVSQEDTLYVLNGSDGSIKRNNRLSRRRECYKVYALNGRYGVYMWSNDTGNTVRHTPVVWDINRDVKREVIAVKGNVLYAIGGTNASLQVMARNGAILTVANNGSVLWRDSLPFNIHDLIVADADGDSCSEIIAAGNQVVLIDSPLNEGGCPTDVYENPEGVETQ